jgi:ADP-ribosylglycohydrolase
MQHKHKGGREMIDIRESNCNFKGPLEAAVWCVLNGDSFMDVLLMAVNMGGDSDTTAAVSGGLAGLCSYQKLFSSENDGDGPIDYINKVSNGEIACRIIKKLSCALGK